MLGYKENKSPKLGIVNTSQGVKVAAIEAGPGDKKLLSSSIYDRQMYQESTFNPKAVSGAGAMGLAQLMPESVKELKKVFGESFDPYNPVDARKGQKYLMESIAEAGWVKGTDDMKMAKTLAAYNMGRTGLVDVLNKIKADGVDIYSDPKAILPYLSKETRNYVTDIMAMEGSKFNEKHFSKSLQAVKGTWLK